MTAQEAIKMLKYNSNVIHKTINGETDINEVEALDMAITALGAIDQIQWERDVAIKQLNDLGYGLGEKPREEVKKASDLIECQAAINEVLSFLVEYCGAAFDEDMQNKLYQRLILLPSAQPDGEYISQQAVTESDLIDWYINSVDESEPVWTEEHIYELFNDFYLIPKENR